VGEGLTLTVAEDRASATALFAVTVAAVVVDTAGAVHRPLLEMLPAVADHTTAVLLVPLTAAANCWLAPEGTVALVGFTLTVILVLVAGLMVTMAEAVDVGNAALVAFIVAEIVEVVVPAVNRPVLEIVPPVADHTTEVLVVPLTEAVNCCVPPELKVAVPGDTWTLTWEPVELVPDATEIESCLSALLPVLSVTTALKLNVPEVFGVPEKMPVLAFMATPGGKVPVSVKV